MPVCTTKHTTSALGANSKATEQCDMPAIFMQLIGQNNGNEQTVQPEMQLTSKSLYNEHV